MITDANQDELDLEFVLIDNRNNKIQNQYKRFLKLKYFKKRMFRIKK